MHTAWDLDGIEPRISGYEAAMNDPERLVHAAIRLNLMGMVLLTSWATLLLLVAGFGSSEAMRASFLPTLALSCLAAHSAGRWYTELG